MPVAEAWEFVCLTIRSVARCRSSQLRLKTQRVSEADVVPSFNSGGKRRNPFGIRRPVGCKSSDPTIPHVEIKRYRFADDSRLRKRRNRAFRCGINLGLNSAIATFQTVRHFSQLAWFYYEGWLDCVNRARLKNRSGKR